MIPQIVSSRSEALKTQEQDVLDTLKDAVKRIEDGEWKPNRLVMILAENDLETFEYDIVYHVRALEALGLIDVMRDKIRSDMTQ